MRGDGQMKTKGRSSNSRLWPAGVLLVALGIGLTAHSAMAQEPAQMFAGTITISTHTLARFTAAVAADGSTVIYLAAVDSDASRGPAMRFMGFLRDNRIRATSTDGTELTGTLVAGRAVGTVGGVGWVGTVTTTEIESPGR
jgi:hypothetical protein